MRRWGTATWLLMLTGVGCSSDPAETAPGDASATAEDAAPAAGEDGASPATPAEDAATASPTAPDAAGGAPALDAGPPREDVPPDGWATLATRCGTAALAHPSGTWVFVGGGALGRTGATIDGIDWVDHSTEARGPGDPGHTRNVIRGVGYGGGLFVAVGGNDNSYISTSCDGSTWRQDVLGTNVEQDPPLDYEGFLSDVAYQDGVFVAAGSSCRRLRSTDGGVTWTPIDEFCGGHFRAIAGGNGLFVAVGEDFAAENAASAVSEDGLTWSEVAFTPGRLDRAIAYGNGVFVAVGGSRCARTTDGLQWDDCGHGATQQGEVHFADGRFYLSTTDGHVHSADAVQWESDPAPLPDSFAHADGLYVGVWQASRGYSRDLVSWTEQPFPFEEGIGHLNAGQIP